MKSNQTVVQYTHPLKILDTLLPIAIVMYIAAHGKIYRCYWKRQELEGSDDIDHYKASKKNNQVAHKCRNVPAY